MVKEIVKFALAGLGRIGRYHALNLLNRVGGATVVAACTIAPADKEWAAEHAPSLRIYDSYEAMLKEEKANGVTAILIASSTDVHASQSIAAIEAGYHVFCEKPLSIHVEEAEKVAEVAKQHPKQKVLCGFSRRFDASYIDAKRQVDEGAIGKPYVLRSQTCDKQDPSGFFVKFAEKSGGIIVDCSIHDLDLTVYFFGEDAVPAQMTAIGSAALHPELQKYNDSDNMLAIIKFHDGRMANLYACRMMMHGQEDTTEIIGTNGKLNVNKQANANLVTLSDAHGIRHEAPKDFYGRFEQAFLNELTTFTRWIQNDEPVPYSLDANVKVLKWAKYLQESFVTGQTLYFDEQGNRINKP
uniref:ARAD1B17776p n=1 Tax=Blastobotrys adeninivorans TaxID=409370 RepID=A0A060T6B0_BLAAD